MPAVPAPHPMNEGERLAALRSYDVLDTGAEAAYDDLVALATHICGTPIGLVSLVDANRQWFKARAGLEAPETPRDLAFCAYTILGDDLLVVPDATRDPRFADNPLVTGDPDIRFYAGAPLKTPDGYALGTLCVIDRVPRELTGQQLEALAALGRQAVAQMELRRNLKNLRTAYERLQGLDQLKSEFVSTVSHELRTPLTSIRGGLQLVLADHEAINGESRDLLTAALHSSERLIRITNDILDLSKLQAGHLKLDRSRCRVNSLIATACETVGHLLEGRSWIRQSPADDDPVIDADQGRIVQALVNLLSNALKFSPPTKTVAVAAVRRDSTVEITVSDEGPGIDEEGLAKLFQPFQQLGSAVNASGGTGLGLVITKGIVEQHGGSVAVTSRLGTGTRFIVTLPLDQPASGKAQAQPVVTGRNVSGRDDGP